MPKCTNCGKALKLPHFDATTISFVVLDKSGHFTTKTSYLCRSLGDTPGCAEDLLGKWVPDLLLSVEANPPKH